MWTLPASPIKSMWLFVKPYVTLTLYKDLKWLKGFEAALMWKALKQWDTYYCPASTARSTGALNQAAYIGSYSAADVSGKTPGDLHGERTQAVVMKRIHFLWWEQDWLWTVPFLDVDCQNPPSCSWQLISECSNKSTAHPSNLNTRVQLGVKSVCMRIPVTNKRVFFFYARSYLGAKINKWQICSHCSF